MAANAVIAVPATMSPDDLRGSIAAGPPEQPGPDHHRVDKRLDDQRVSECLGDDHELHGTAAESAVLLGQGGAEDAEFVGETGPDLRLPALAGLDRGAAALQAVSRASGTW